jgi:protein tyrosine phosphatase
MLISHKTYSDYINAYIEFDVVNHLGIQTNNGEYLFIRDIWIHHTLNGQEEIAKFILKLDEHEHTKSVKYIYWERQKRDNKLSRLFNRETCLKRMLKILWRNSCLV